VSWVEAAEFWVVTGYKLASEVLNNRALRTTLHPGSMDLTDATPFLRAIRVAMVLSTHAERHRKIRALFNGIMSPRTITQLRPATAQSAHRLIDRVAARGHMDVVKEYGLAIPFEQISELLCVTEDVRGPALRWTHAIFAGVREIMYGTNDPQVLGVADVATIEMNAYFTKVIEERRSVPSDDTIGAMVKSAAANGLTDEELCANIWILYIGGYETTGTGLSTGILRLHQHPDSLDLLRRQPQLLPLAVEEVLRFDTPSFALGRVTDTDLQIGDQMVRAGERIIIHQGAANYDPAQFPDPDRFDITRKTRSLSFGTGPHMCVGQLLARMNIETAYSVLLERLPSMLIDDLDPPMTPCVSGGLPSLPASWDPAKLQ
jgi:cytochrome P450